MSAVQVDRREQKKKLSIDFDWALGLNRLSLNVMGVWPLPDDRADVFARSARIPVMLVTIMLGVFMPEMYALTKVYRHLPLVVDNLITSCAALVSTAKLFVIWYRRNVIKHLILTITNDWLREKSDWERRIMIKQASRARLFTISGYVVMLGCVLCFVASPMFGLSIRVLNNITDGDRYFPVQTSYPYDTQRSPIFELTYTSQLLASGFIGVTFCIPENFFGALVFHASAKCEILEVKMAMLMGHGGGNLVRLKLRRLVRMHVILIRFVDAIESSFNMLVLSHVVCLTVIIACMAYSVISSLENEGENISLIQILTLTSSVSTLMILMFELCLASEILADHSSKLVGAIGQTNFYLLPSNCSRDIQIIMIYSQNPLQLTAGKFFYLSLNAYLQFVKNTGAYISMLLAVNK